MITLTAEGDIVYLRELVPVMRELGVQRFAEVELDPKWQPPPAPTEIAAGIPEHPIVSALQQRQYAQKAQIQAQFDAKVEDDRVRFAATDGTDY